MQKQSKTRRDLFSTSHQQAMSAGNVQSFPGKQGLTVGSSCLWHGEAPGLFWQRPALQPPTAKALLPITSPVCVGHVLLD